MLKHLGFITVLLLLQSQINTHTALASSFKKNNNLSANLNTSIKATENEPLNKYFKMKEYLQGKEKQYQEYYGMPYVEPDRGLYGIVKRIDQLTKTENQILFSENKFERTLDENLKVEDKQVPWPEWFEGVKTDDMRLLPKMIYRKNFVTNLLEKEVDPENLPHRYTVTMWFKHLLKRKSNFRNDYSSVNVELNIFKHKVSDVPLTIGKDVRLYDDFLFLPLKFRKWLIKDIWGKGYVLSALKGEPVEEVKILFNLKTAKGHKANGRAGMLFWKDTRLPIIVSTPQGELAFNIKGIGTYKGNSPENLEIDDNRLYAKGWNQKTGGFYHYTISQILGQITNGIDDDDEPGIILETISKPFRDGLTSRALYAETFRFRENPEVEFRTFARADVSQSRLGEIAAGDDSEFNPEKDARILAKNVGTILTGYLSGVHKGLGLANVMETGYYLDHAGMDYFYAEINPKDSLYKHIGYALNLLMYSFKDFKSANFSNPTTIFLDIWLNSFLNTVFGNQTDIKFQIKNEFSKFHKNNQKDPQKFIKEFVSAIWDYYLSYRVLQDRIDFGFDPDISAQTPNPLHRLTKIDRYSKKAAIAFIQNEKELLEKAQNLIANHNYPELPFNFEKALDELDNKELLVKDIKNQSETDFIEVYSLSYYGPWIGDVFKIKEVQQNGKRKTIRFQKNDQKIDSDHFEKVESKELDWLFGELNNRKRIQMAKNLDIDQRPIENGLLDPIYVSTNMEMNKVINPEGKKVIALYGGAGADISNFLLRVNSQEAYFAEQTPLDMNKIKKHLKNWDQFGSKYFEEIDKQVINELKKLNVPEASWYTSDYYRNNSIKYYLEQKRVKGFGVSAIEGMTNIELRILVELWAMGVKKEDLTVEHDKKNETIKFIFYWQYHKKSKNKYQISYITTDITNVKKYPFFLKNLLKEKIDLYMQNAGFHLIKNMRNFLPTIMQSLSAKALIVMDDAYIDYINGEYIYKNTSLDVYIQSLGFSPRNLTIKDKWLQQLQDAIKKFRKNKQEKDKVYYPTKTPTKGWLNYGNSIEILSIEDFFYDPPNNNSSKQTSEKALIKSA